MADPVCDEGGFLVGTRYPIPEDPGARFTAGAAYAGCNRVYCDLCASWVRHFDGYCMNYLVPPVTDPQTQLYELTAPERSPHLTRAEGGDQFRVYACRCRTYQTPGLNALVETETGWRCAGHPQGAANPRRG